MAFNPDSSPSNHSSTIHDPGSGLLKDLVLLAGIVALFFVLWPEPAAGTDSGNSLRIVFEATNGSPEAADVLIGRIESAQRNFHGQAEIAIIAYWDGVRMLRATENPFAQRLTRLADAGVDIIVGQQSMKDAEMPESDLLPFARTVRSGAEEARRMEKQGWARVRDGETYVSPL
jgi:intracellular sulfur oxidation DsrE/DsrF family protein